MYGSPLSKGERSEEGEIGSGHPHTMGGLTYAGSGAWEKQAMWPTGLHVLPLQDHAYLFFREAQCAVWETGH